MRPSILLTRPQHASERFAAQLRDRVGKLDVLISPVMQIEPLMQTVEIGEARALIFSSANAVPFGVAGMRCFCVGDATARAAQAAGMQATSAEGDASDLIRRILADGESGPFLHIRGKHTRGEIAQRLTEAGCLTREAIAYDQVVRPLSEHAKSLLTGNSPVLVPVFSPRTAKILSDVQGLGPNVWGVALSPVVAENMKNLPAERIHTCAAPNAKAMLDLLEGLIDAATRLEG
jgi:uroporphyrinogen-III synthase